MVPIAVVGVTACCSPGPNPIVHWTLVPFALAFWSLFQSVPLPLSISEFLSPNAVAIRETLPTADKGTFLPISLDPGASVAEGARWATYGSVLLLSSRLSGRHTSLLLRSTLAVLATLALVTLAHAMTDTDRVFGLYRPTFDMRRAPLSPVLNPNNLAALTNLGACLAVGFLHDAKNPSRRLWAAVSLGPLVVTTILSGSRAGILTMLFGLLCMIALPRRTAGQSSTKQWRLIGVAAIAASLITMAGANDTLRKEITDDSLTKVQLIGPALQLLADYWSVGAGAGAFESAFQGYRDTPGNFVWSHPENFALAWLCEWGLVVGGLAICALVWSILPRPLMMHRNSRRLGAYVGLVLLLGQNLVDVGSSVPAVVVLSVSTLGIIAGSVHTHRASGALTQLTPVVAVVLLLCSLGAAIRVGLRSADDDRRAASAILRNHATTSLQPSSAAAVAIENAAVRHPADSFLSLANAILARNSDPALAMKWTARALRLEPMNGNAHFFLAHELKRRGALNQALMELRLAVERDERLRFAAAKSAIAWSKDEPTLLRAVPAGPPGLPMLEALVQEYHAVHPNGFALILSRTAKDRAPSDPAVSLTWVREMLRVLSTGANPCPMAKNDCLDSIALELDRIARSTETAALESLEASLAIARGDLAMLRGDGDEALATLRIGCSRSSTDCLQHWVRLAHQLGRDLDDPAKLYLLAACTDDAHCAGAHRWIGETYLNSGNAARALHHFKEETKLAPSPKALLRLAKAAEHAEYFELAIRSLERSLELEPNQARVRAEIERLRRINDVQR